MRSGQHYLGHDRRSLKGSSLYDVLHPESIKEVQAKHRLSKWKYGEFYLSASRA